VDDVISNIPISEYHQPHLAKKRNYAPYDGSRERVGTITCSGGSGTKNGYHPTGLRDFTAAEIARLQGIVPEHSFRGSAAYVKKVIGDMVPSEAWKFFLMEAVKTLEEFDAKNPSQDLLARPSHYRNGSSSDSPIVVDNSDNVDATEVPRKRPMRHERIRNSVRDSSNSSTSNSTKRSYSSYDIDSPEPIRRTKHKVTYAGSVPQGATAIHLDDDT
jgi:hypothetical protein